MLEALAEDSDSFQGSVIVIRYEGPKGGPGMPRCSRPPPQSWAPALGRIALITDGRFSGSHGFVIGHVTPEAQVGGPIGLVQDGDIIEIDAEKRTINALDIADEDWKKRKAEGGAAPRSHQWHAVQVHQARGLRVPGMHHRPVSDAIVQYLSLKV